MRAPLTLAMTVVLAAPAVAAAPAPVRLAGCPVFPADNPWNQRVDKRPIAPDSARLIASIGADDAERRGSGWHAGSGAVWNLRSNRLRPRGWTSADAAGLPILPGLARAGEVRRGAIRHALRFTVQRTRRGYIHPARHFASSSTDPTLPPMGLRVRLKRGFDLSGYPRQARIVLVALKRYGMILADNGSDWFITGAPSSRWNDDALNAIKRVRGADLEVVAPSR